MEQVIMQSNRNLTKNGRCWEPIFYSHPSKYIERNFQPLYYNTNPNTKIDQEICLETFLGLFIFTTFEMIE